jgi:hypothetical protein
LMSPNDISADRKACNDANYISRVISAFSSLSTNAKLSSVPTVSTVSKSISYEQLFTDYISVNQPVKGALEIPLKYTSDIISLDCGLKKNYALKKCDEYMVCFKVIALHF